MNEELLKLLEYKRDYVNSLEDYFRDNGFNDHINYIKEEIPSYDFFDHTLGGYDMLYEPIHDLDGKIITIDPKSDNLDEQIEEYIFNYLLNTNNFD